MKWSEKDKKKVNDLIAKYRNILKLNNWEIEVTFDNEKLCVENGEVGAEINSNITYTRASLTFYLTTLERWKSMGITSLEDTIKHELCHMLTEQLYLYGCQRHIEERELTHAREKLTEHISKLI